MATQRESLAVTPDPPHYAVVFTSARTPGDHGYAATAKEMLALASQQPGFLGFETARQEIGITVSYWRTLEAIQAWKDNPAHRAVQARAQDWYATFRVRICRVDREYEFQLAPQGLLDAEALRRKGNHEGHEADKEPPDGVTQRRSAAEHDATETSSLSPSWETTGVRELGDINAPKGHNLRRSIQ